MRATVLLCGAVLAFLVYESAGAGTIGSAADEAVAADAAVRGAVAGIDAAWNAGDAVAFAARWAEYGVVISPMGEMTEGRADIQADMAAQFIGPLKGTRHKLDVKRVYDVRSGVAIVDGEAIVQAPDGTPWTAHFNAVFARDEDGRWLVDYMTSYVYISR